MDQLHVGCWNDTRHGAMKPLSFSVGQRGCWSRHWYCVALSVLLAQCAFEDSTPLLPISTGEHVNASDPASYLAAKVALLVVREALDVSTETEKVRYAMLPSRLPLSEREAAEILASMPKPIHCEAVPLGDLAALQCQPLSRADLIAHHNQGARRSIESFDTAISDNAPAGTVDPLLAVRGSSDSIVVPWSVVKQWFSDYVQSHGVRFDPPDGTARGQNAVAVLTFGRGRISVVL